MAESTALDHTLQEVRMYDFISIGEILVDLTPAGADPSGRMLYQANPGGAPANVACVVAKFGGRVAFIGTVGDDAFGRSCLAALREAGVDVGFSAISVDRPTTLAAVGLDAGGNRSFSFYRTRTADLELSLQGLPEDLFSGTQALHFGSLSLAAGPAREATLKAVEMARQAGRLVSFDPNFRAMVWESPDQARREINAAAPLATVLKISLEEAELLFNTSDPERACREARARFGTPLAVVTLAEHGCCAFLGGRLFRAPAHPVDVRDTTGAGDAFCGALVYYLIANRKTGLDLSDGEVLEMLALANAAGSLTTTRLGAIGAIPSLAEARALAGFG